MTMHIKAIGLMIFLAGFFILSNSVHAASLSNIQKKELTLFGMKSMGLNVGIEQVKNVLSMSEINEMVKTGLNLNGHLCAELVKVYPLRGKGTYEATCIAYRGGSAQKSYIIDSNKGIAFVP